MALETADEIVHVVTDRLRSSLSPTVLFVLDESDLHAGHAHPIGMYHLAVRIASPDFQGRPLLNCHRLVYDVLRDIICRAVHALRIEIIRG